jgi:hypothetical protein
LLKAFPSPSGYDKAIAFIFYLIASGRGLSCLDEV